MTRLYLKRSGSGTEWVSTGPRLDTPPTAFTAPTLDARCVGYAIGCVVFALWCIFG